MKKLFATYVTVGLDHRLTGSNQQGLDLNVLENQTHQNQSKPTPDISRPAENNSTQT